MSFLERVKTTVQQLEQNKDYKGNIETQISRGLDEGKTTIELVTPPALTLEEFGKIVSELLPTGCIFVQPKYCGHMYPWGHPPKYGVVMRDPANPSWIATIVVDLKFLPK